jgi:NPCBM-associated, NEW3 domain of alpha-galactosidase
MRERLIGAQGGKQVLQHSLRLLAAIFVSTLILSGVSAQGNSAAASGSPSSRGLQNGLNQEVELEGELEITYQDFKDGHHKLSYSLKQSNGSRVPLQFAKEPPTHLLSGARVRVKGQRSGGSLVLYSGSSSLAASTTSGDATGSTSSSIPVPYTFGTQSTLVILVNFQDDVGEPYSITQVQNAFFTATNNFFVENSYGQTSIAGDVVGWYTIPVSYTTCDISQIATASQNAATAAGVNLSAYTRYVYFFVYNTGCGFSGASQVGGNPSQSWINSTLNPYVINHELGHAFGLWHSHWLDCSSTATVCSSGSIVEYGDNLDTMGLSSASPDYNAYQKERLGWLNYGASPTIQTVTTSGTYTINPYELGSSGPNALKVLKSTDPTTGAKTWYYLEARQAIGFDAFFTNGTCPQCYTQNETTGVLFHLGTDGDGNSSELIDMTPATAASGYYDDSLLTGQTFQDSTAGVTFTPTAVSGSGATVQITMNGSAGSSCTAANPTVSVSPSQSQSVPPGTAVSFTVSVTDKDSSSCAAATFNLASALPSGWTGTWNTTALSLASGKSGSATLTVISPAGTADGSYTVGVNAINSTASSYRGSTAAQYVINTAPLTVSLATNQSNYLPGQTVAINVTMLFGTTPDAGASVAVTVTAPNGRATTLSGTTGSNGVALLNYKLSNSAAAGTYLVQAQAGAAKSSGGGRTKGGAVATAASASAAVGASTSFTVQ